jgi:hypothetical protein
LPVTLHIPEGRVLAFSPKDADVDMQTPWSSPDLQGPAQIEGS